MSDSIAVFVARATNGRAVHYFPTDSLRPVCDRLKNTPDGIDVTDDEVTCAACRTKFAKGGFHLHEDAPVQDDLGDDLEQDDDIPTDEEDGTLEGAEDDEDEEDEDEEDERSTTKAQKFTSFAHQAGWKVRIWVGTGKFTSGDVTFATAKHGDVSIRLAWQEGRYQYNETRIIKGQGELLNQLVRNASAARGFIRAIGVDEDARRPILRPIAK